MAKKDETPSLVEQFAEFKEMKSIDKTTMIDVLEESFRKVLQGMFSTDSNFDVILNPDKGDVQIFQNFEIVPDDTEDINPNTQIRLSEAQADDNPEAEVGEEHTREIIFEKFGRRAILNLRQTLQSKILELHKEATYNKYKALVGELISGDVYQTWSKETLLVDDDGTELVMPKPESIPGDYFHKGETVRAVIKEVTDKNNPKVIVSRTSNDFLRRLFELEVPEIHDGLIYIRAVARIPGERAKIAVESFDERIDPVGACVGVKGSRIHGIVRELHNENIDVVNYASNPELFITRALAPAKISQIRIDVTRKRAEVFLHPEEVSKAIGKNGSNIKLASLLTGYEIEVYRDVDTYDPDDIYLDEFKNEIDEWVIDALKEIGLITAKSVLRAPREMLIEKADLEESTVDNVLEILRSEEYDHPV